MGFFLAFSQNYTTIITAGLEHLSRPARPTALTALLILFVYLRILSAVPYTQPTPTALAAMKPARTHKWGSGVKLASTGDRKQTELKG